jgi:hypothetical protein
MGNPLLSARARGYIGHCIQRCLESHAQRRSVLAQCADRPFLRMECALRIPLWREWSKVIRGRDVRYEKRVKAALVGRARGYVVIRVRALRCIMLYNINGGNSGERVVGTMHLRYVMAHAQTKVQCTLFNVVHHLHASLA